MEGTIVANKYRLVRLLGKGGMGSVWLAEHLTLKTDVAVKLIDSELGNQAQPRARFVREAQLAARVKSAHVAQIFDHGMAEDGQPYIVMEYLTGETLRDRLDRGRLPIRDTARVVSHVCRALARAHEAGLIHRDLKPENLFIAREGEDEIVKVLDFGVAKAADALADSTVDPTRTGAMMGTPYYMSPEQAQGLKTIDHRADLWAMGAVVFECLTGERQFTGGALGPLVMKIMTAPIKVPTAVVPDARLPAEVDAFVLRALERDPAARFSTARELSEAFLVATGLSASGDRDIPGSSWPPTGQSPPSRALLPVEPASVLELAATAISPTTPARGGISGPPGAMDTIQDARPSMPQARLPWLLVAAMGVIIVVLGVLLVRK